MAQISKVYNFEQGLEDWVATKGHANIFALWYPPHRQKSVSKHNEIRAGFDPLKSLGGCLRMTAPSNPGFNVPQTENYWELTKTWEELGVPAGAIVTQVKADYNYRWEFRKASSRRSQAIWGEKETGTGPFELRRKDETLIGTFSTRIFSIPRTIDDFWVGYPQDPDYPHSDTWKTQYPITETPPTWGLAVGDTLDVPENMRASDTIVKFRLRNLLPATVAERRKYVRLKQDRIVLTITYETPSVAGSNVILIQDNF